MPPTSPSFPSLPARAVGALAGAAAAVVWTHALAGLTASVGPADAPRAAVPLTLAALVAAVAALLPAHPERALLRALAASAVAGLGVTTAFPGAWAAALALPPAVVAATVGGLALARRLPSDLATFPRRRPRVAAAWTVLALAAVVQVARLSSWITDPEVDWFLATRHSFWADHECLPAYLHGAELAARGENPYDPGHFPALTRDAAPVTALAGMVIEDPFQYPPTFLVLPRLALAATDDYRLLRTLWFGIGATAAFGLVALSLRWMGGQAGRQAMWLLPAFALAFPVLHALQYGQFHLLAVALATVGMICFAARRPALGGALLAGAIASKVFPAILLVPLVVGRRWTALAWTAAWGIAFTALALAVLGPAPFVAFVQDQVPRLGSGAAFAFDRAWPEIRDVMIADNQGAFGLVRKLAALGVPGVSEAAAATANRVYGLLVLALAAGVSVLRPPRSRTSRLAFWLALLGLASMASPGAFGDYVPATTCWLALALVSRLQGGVVGWTMLGATVAFQAFFLGTSPIGGWFPPAPMIALSALGVMQAWALLGWAAVARSRTAELEERDGERAVPVPAAVSA